MSNQVLKPKRIQRKRTKGWKMPDGVVCVTRPGKWGNPFKVGGYFKIGDGIRGFCWLQALSAEYSDSSFTLIESASQAVEF